MDSIFQCDTSKTVQPRVSFPSAPGRGKLPAPPPPGTAWVQHCSLQGDAPHYFNICVDFSFSICFTVMHLTQSLANVTKLKHALTVVGPCFCLSGQPSPKTLECGKLPAAQGRNGLAVQECQQNTGARGGDLSAPLSSRGRSQGSK